MPAHRVPIHASSEINQLHGVAAAMLVVPALLWGHGAAVGGLLLWMAVYPGPRTMTPGTLSWVELEPSGAIIVAGQHGVLRPTSQANRFWVRLDWQAGGQPRHLIVWRDAVNPADFCRLRRAVTVARQALPSPDAAR